MLRSARLMGVPFKLPSTFPINGVAATRAFYWLNSNDTARAQKFASAAYRAFFAEDRDISKAETVAEIAARCGVTEDDTLAAINSDAIKNLTRKEVDAAIALGVFGSPYFVVDDEPFWGADRLDQMAAWLKKPW